MENIPVYLKLHRNDSAKNIFYRNPDNDSSIAKSGKLDLKFFKIFALLSANGHMTIHTFSSASGGIYAKHRK